jgi:hypothetical protein
MPKMLVGNLLEFSRGLLPYNLPVDFHNNDQCGKRVFADPYAGPLLSYNRLEQLQKYISHTYKPQSSTFFYTNQLSLD